MNMNQFYIYILTNSTNNVFYIGFTNNLIRRIHEHIANRVNSFSSKYKTYKLVHFEIVTDPITAISREKQLKNWHRSWKINLIKINNPSFNDLSKDILL